MRYLIPDLDEMRVSHVAAKIYRDRIVAKIDHVLESMNRDNMYLVKDYNGFNGYNISVIGSIIEGSIVNHGHMLIFTIDKDKALVCPELEQSLKRAKECLQYTGTASNIYYIYLGLIKDIQRIWQDFIMEK